MPELTDVLGNKLANGQYVQLRMDNGDTVYGTIEELEQGGTPALSSVAEKMPIKPATFFINVGRMPVLARPGMRMTQVVVVKSPEPDKKPAEA